MILYYIRHGDPIYDPDSLTPLGGRQAEAVGRRIAAHGIDRIFASSSNRAMLTATPLSELTKRKIEVLDWCHEDRVWNEFAAPDKNGNKSWYAGQEDWRILFLSPELQALADNWTSHPKVAETAMPAGMERVNRELDSWIASLGFTHDRVNHLYHPNGVTPPKRIALFAHQGFSWTFFSSLLDIPYPQFCTHFDIQHTGVSVVYLNENKETAIPCVLQYSCDAHLYAEHLPTKYLWRDYL